MSDTVALATGLPGHIQPGAVIAGKYRLEQEIGRGSMGTVYRAVHVTLGQRVAIKLISGPEARSAEARQRFSVEAKAAAKLRSRHVVQVIDDGETPHGTPYIVLELLEGETLEQRIEREHSLPLADAVRVVTHVGRALARAHAQGIVHRDLRPAHVFLARSDDDEAGWVAKVLDFGIAKLAHPTGATRAGAVLGTPRFLSPEQVRGASAVDHRADLYALGMCLFHALTGVPAYHAENDSHVLAAIGTQPLPRLRERAPWLPEAVEHWFQRACARDPIDRFQSADEMTEALRAAAGALTPLSKHQSVPEGRIAPETLVGFAAPPQLTLPLGAAPVAWDRTQVLPPSAAPEVAPRGFTEVASLPATTDAGRRSPPRNLRPALIGLGWGVLAVLSLGVTLAFLGSSHSQRAAPPSPRADPAPPRATASSAAAPGATASSGAAAWTAVAEHEPSGTTPPSAPSVVSSVAAEAAPSPAARQPASRSEAAKKAAAPPARTASPDGASAARAASSDLGF